MTKCALLSIRVLEECLFSFFSPLLFNNLVLILFRAMPLSHALTLQSPSVWSSASIIIWTESDDWPGVSTTFHCWSQKALWERSLCVLDLFLFSFFFFLLHCPEIGGLCVKQLWFSRLNLRPKLKLKALWTETMSIRPKCWSSEPTKQQTCDFLNSLYTCAKWLSAGLSWALYSRRWVKSWNAKSSDVIIIFISLECHSTFNH